MTEYTRNMEELAPVRYRTEVLARIERLSEERRNLMGKIARFDDGRSTRSRLDEIEEELTQLWEVRRHELR